MTIDELTRALGTFSWTNGTTAWVDSATTGATPNAWSTRYTYTPIGTTANEWVAWDPKVRNEWDSQGNYMRDVACIMAEYREAQEEEPPESEELDEFLASMRIREDT